MKGEIFEFIANSSRWADRARYRAKLQRILANILRQDPELLLPSKYFGRDFSLDGLIYVAIQLKWANKHYDKYATVFESEKTVLTHLEEMVRSELLTKYRIKELAM